VGRDLTFPPRRRLLPGGGARPDPSPFEKVYVCLVGSVTVIINGVEFVLSPMDSCTVAHNEVREIVNHQNNVATTLVVMPYRTRRRDCTEQKITE
jgi:hypothetical protein